MNDAEEIKLLAMYHSHSSGKKLHSSNKLNISPLIHSQVGMIQCHENSSETFQNMMISHSNSYSPRAALFLVLVVVQLLIPPLLSRNVPARTTHVLHLGFVVYRFIVNAVHLTILIDSPLLYIV